MTESAARDSIPPSRAKDELVLLANRAMRARRRPKVILFLWAWQAVWGAALAWPAASIVSASYGTHPEGDLPLFRAGGLELLDLLYGAQRAEAGLVNGHFFALLPLVLVAGLLPLGAVVASVAHATRDGTEPRLRVVIARGASAFGAFFWLLVAAAAASLALFLLVATAASATSAGFAARMGEAKADQLALIVAGVTLLPLVVVGVLHDLARAAVVRFRVGALRSIGLAWNTWRRAPVRSLWSWGWRALAAWVPVALGAFAAVRLGGRAGIALAALFGLHQAALLARAALRASWLARALRDVDHAHRVVKVVSPT